MTTAAATLARPIDRRAALLGRAALHCGAVALFAGCAGTPPPPAPLATPAGFAATVDTFAGTLLSGPLGADAVALVPTAPAQAFRLKVQLLLLDSIGRFDALVAAQEKSAAAVVPLVDALGLVADLRAAEAIDATSRLVGGGSLARGGAARLLFDALVGSAPIGALPLTERDEVVLLSASTVVAATGEGASLLTVAVHGEDESRADVTLEYDTADRGGEMMKLADCLVAGGDPLLLIVPAPFRGESGRACALLLELSAPPPAGEALDRHAQEVAAALARVTRAGEEAARTTNRAAARANRSSTMVAALRGLNTGAACRTALVYLATNAKAELLGDVALVASEEDLVRLLHTFCDDRAQLLDYESNAERLGWSIEREAWRFLATTALESEIAPELSALLYLHAGAVGAWPATLEDITDNATDAAAFAAKLVDENLCLLEDHSAAVRVRAFDWLKDQGAAPDGFDQLAPFAARRAALAGREHAGE